MRTDTGWPAAELTSTNVMAQSRCPTKLSRFVASNNLLPRNTVTLECSWQPWDSEEFVSPYVPPLDCEHLLGQLSLLVLRAARMPAQGFSLSRTLHRAGGDSGVCGQKQSSSGKPFTI